MAVEVSIFQTVHVVSIEAVTTRFGDFSFHEKLVRGAPVEWFWTLDCWEYKSALYKHHSGHRELCRGRVKRKQ